MTREYVNEYLELFESLLRAMRNGDSFYEEVLTKRARELQVTAGEYVKMVEAVKDIIAQEKRAKQEQ